MKIEDVFQYIRQENVVLFIGSGTSLSAGYPSCYDLKKILHKNLKSKEREFVNLHLPLDHFAEEFCRIKNDNRKSLLQILSNIFSHRNQSTDWHYQLAKISHIRNIITTNYDNLLEAAYGNKCNVIYSSQDIPSKRRSRQTNIYKIHGDVKRPDNIIITKSDYNMTFRNNEENTVLWAEIKSIIANNNVLFLGYSLEDSNVTIMYENILSELGDKMKQVFLIAPNLPSHKVSDLNNKQIVYFDMTAERFLKELSLDINENVVADFHQGGISSDTLISYSKNKNILPTLTTVNDKHVVTNFSGINDSKITYQLSFDISNADNYGTEISNYFSGNNFNPLIIPRDKIVKSAIFAEGIKLANKQFQKLIFTPKPAFESIVSVKVGNLPKYNNVDVKVFKKNEDYVEVRVKLKNASCTLKFEVGSENFIFQYQHKKTVTSVTSEINELKLLSEILSGNSFNVESKTIASRQHPGCNNPSMKETMVSLLNYFENLKFIEEKTNIRFGKFDFAKLTKGHQELVELIKKALCREKIELKWDGIVKIKFSPFLPDHNGLNKFEIISLIYSNEKEIAEIHNRKINLGYQILHLLDPHILKKDEQSIHLQSKSEKIVLNYSLEKPD